MAAACLPLRTCAKEEEKQEEEESADTAPPKKVLVGWGGSEALEKAPINLRAEFTRHVQDASSSPHASTSSKAQPELAANEANSAAANVRYGLKDAGERVVPC